MQKTQNLQDIFLNQVRRDRSVVTMFLMNGFQLHGIVRGFDGFTVVLESDGTPKSGGYNPMYVGPQAQRDYAYHQGTAWPWLGGFYMEACLRVYKRTRLSFIERQMVGYEDEMVQHCLGTIPELFDGNPPFHGRGAISFAINVAEVLRTLELLEKYKY